MPLMSQPMISVAGIRGIVGDSLTPDSFLQYLLAFATLADGRPVVLGCDSRLSRDMLRHLAFAALSSAGCDVIDIGMACTPTVGIMVKELKAGGGIAVTASHNPSQWNAYKFFGPDGCFLSREKNTELLAICETQRYRRASYRNLGRVRPLEGSAHTHLKRVLAAVDLSGVPARRFKVVVDCVNGVGASVIGPLLEKLKCQVVYIDNDPTQEFPRNPEPLPENLTGLCDAVIAENADIGFAVDPDGDRLAIVDETGRAIGEERTIVLAADALLSGLGRAPLPPNSTESDLDAAPAPKGPIVVNLSTTRAIDDVAVKHGVDLYRTPIGEANVVEAILEAEALVGGEGNGGVIFPNVHPGRDAATGVALVLAHLAAHGGKASELNATIPDYVMVKQKSGADDLDPSTLSGRMRVEFVDAERISAEDGIKADYADCWVHLRPSGTEPVVRIFAEAPDAEKAAALVMRVRQKVLLKKGIDFTQMG